MLTLNDGRADLWQWDTGRTLAVDADCSQVHFSNKVFGRSIDVDVVDGAAIIPDILLQTDKDLNVWAFVGTAENGYTKISKTFKVNRRNKPADYVFTPVEQTTIAEIAAIAQSVRDDADAGRFDGAQGPAGEAGGFYTPAVTQPNENTMRLSFSPSKKGMPAVADTDIALPSGGGGGGSGEDGGYYTPVVTQQSGNTMQVSFTPSKAAMPAVDRTEITLPAGPAGSKGEKGDKGADGKSAYQYALEGGYTGTEAEFAAKLVQEKFANPNALTFTGAVTGSYDGSAPLSVEIPSGGGSGGSGGGEWQTILTGETTVEAVTRVTIPMTASDFDEYRAVIIVGKNTDGTTGDNNTNIWIDGYRCAYYMMGINYGNYIGTFSISVEPIPETAFLSPNGISTSAAKKATVSRWINSPTDGGSAGISAIICPNTSPTGVLQIQFGKAYSGTIRHEVMAR